MAVKDSEEVGLGMDWAGVDFEGASLVGMGLEGGSLVGMGLEEGSLVEVDSEVVDLP